MQVNLMVTLISLLLPARCYKVWVFVSRLYSRDVQTGADRYVYTFSHSRVNHEKHSKKRWISFEFIKSSTEIYVGDLRNLCLTLGIFYNRAMKIFID